MREINFRSNHSIKQRKYLMKNTISIEKTTANETISRDQKSRREKNKSTHQSSSRNILSRKSSTSRNPLTVDLIKHKFQTARRPSILSKMNNQNMKTINEIYRPVQKQRKQTIHCQLNRKTYFSKQLGPKLKVRSNSHHNLPTAFTRDASKNKLLSSLKPSKNPISKIVLGMGSKKSI